MHVADKYGQKKRNASAQTYDIIDKNKNKRRVPAVSYDENNKRNVKKNNAHKETGVMYDKRDNKDLNKNNTKRILE